MGNKASGIAAGRWPRCTRGGFAGSNRNSGHDVSIRIGVGRYVGSQPRAKTSMTIIRPPQRGQGQGRIRGSCGAATFSS